MHDLDAGRIFWKEWRAQRSFWLALIGMSVGLDVLLTFVTIWNQLSTASQLGAYNYVAIVLACSFATGSAAIAFAGEIEGKTYGLLQRLPLRTRDLFIGKFALSTVGSYLLLLVAWVAGQVILSHASPGSIHERPTDISEEWQWFSSMLLLPLAFVVVGGLVSVVFSEVLLTSLIAGIATAILFGVPAIRKNLEYQAFIIALVTVCDFFLVRAGCTTPVRSDRAYSLASRGRGARASYQVRRRMTAVESMRSAVAWQRGASSLIWKELRQAAPFCLKLWVVGLITVLLARISNNLKRLDDNWVAIIGLTLVAVAPLLVGVAAVRAERREGAFRLLADHGVSPHGVTICKHLVWLLLSLTVFGILLFIDRDLLASQRVPSRTASLWDVAAEVASTNSLDHFTGLRDVGLAAPLGTAAFFVVLLYAMGYFAAILIPGSVAAFFVSAIALLGLVFMLGARSISRHPLLVDSRSHSGHLPRRCLGAHARLAGRTKHTASVGQSGRVCRGPDSGDVRRHCHFSHHGNTGDGRPGIGSRGGLGDDCGRGANRGFLPLYGRDAGDERPAAMGGPRPRPRRHADTPGWLAICHATREGVGRTERGCGEVALEASELAGKSAGTSRASEARDPNLPVSNSDQFVWLSQLLLYNARKLEADGHLDEALACYVAAARLTHKPDFSLAWIDQWAMNIDQTGARIKRAIREFEALQPSPPRFRARFCGTGAETGYCSVRPSGTARKPTRTSEASRSCGGSAGSFPGRSSGSNGSRMPFGPEIWNRPNRSSANWTRRAS